MTNKRNNIKISRKTADRLRKFGIMGSTYDSILNDLMDHADFCDMYWNSK